MYLWGKAGHVSSWRVVQRLSLHNLGVWGCSKLRSFGGAVRSGPRGNICRRKGTATECLSGGAQMWQRVVSSQGSPQTVQAEGGDAQTDEQPPQPEQQSPDEPAAEQVEAGAGCWSCAGVFACGSREEEGGEAPPKQQPTAQQQQPPAERNDRWKERGDIMRQGWLTCFKFAFQGLGLEFVTTCMAIMFVIILISGVMDMTGRLAVTEISKHAMNAETMAVLTQAELTLRTPIQLCVLMGRSDAPERGDTRFDLFANDTSYDRLFYAIGDVLDRTEYECK